MGCGGKQGGERLRKCLGVGKEFHQEPGGKADQSDSRPEKAVRPRLFSQKGTASRARDLLRFRAEPAVLDIKAAYGGKPLTVHLQRRGMKDMISFSSLVTMGSRNWTAGELSFDGRSTASDYLGRDWRLSEMPHADDCRRTDAQ